MAIYLQSNVLKGNATTKGLENTVNVKHLSFDVNSPAQMHVGCNSERTAGKPKLSVVSFSKSIDSASNTLFEYACTGKVIDSVKFIINEVDKSERKYAEYILYDVMVSQFATSVNDMSKPAETIDFSYSRLEVHYLAAKQGPIRSGFDLKQAELV